MRDTFTILAVMIFVASSGFCGDGFTRIHSDGKGARTYNLGPLGLKGHCPDAKLRRQKDNLNFFVITEIAAGSPADGSIQTFDVITGVNGTPFPQKTDMRFLLAKSILESEIKDGRLQLNGLRGGKPFDVVIRLEKVPDFSPTWPIDCKRTDTMLLNACEYLAKEQMPDGNVVSDDGHIGALMAGLLWLSMGEPAYLGNARRTAYWFADQLKQDKLGTFLPWTCGYGGILLAEYYHMTGDRAILPGLEYTAARIAKGQMPSGGWCHGFYSGFGAGYGEVNNAGMNCYTVLLLARECGVKVDMNALKKAERYYDKLSPTLTNQYGDHFWRNPTYNSLNGKVGGLAVAHRLNGRSVESAGYALKAARSMDTIEWGHTGHFWNLVWNPVGASLAPAKEYRNAMDQVGWYYVLSRTWDGGLTSQPSKGGYNLLGPKKNSGGIALGLSVARRHLRISGAPKSVFLQKLPAELDTARALHQTNKWDKAIATVDAFLKKGGHDKETVRLANELRDKARYVKEDVQLAYAELRGLNTGGRLNMRPWEITRMMRPLKKLLGDDDPELMAITNALPQKFRGVWRTGQQLYGALNSLMTLKAEYWFIHSKLSQRAVPTLTMPYELESRTALGKVDPKGSDWRHLRATTMPAGWSKPSFDDSKWNKPPLGRKGRGNSGYTLVRIPFHYDGSVVKKPRISIDKNQAIGAGCEVFLNGIQVLKSETGFRTGRNGGGGIDLLPSVISLLRKGTNVLAFSTPDQGSLPTLKFEVVKRASITPDITPFAWTPVPGRDAEFRKLTAKWGLPTAHYVASKDTRNVKQVMQALTAEPVFMPDIYNAIGRFETIAPDLSDKTAAIEALLKSTSHGARWAGLHIVTNAISIPTGKKWRWLRGNAKQKVLASQKIAIAWAKPFIPRIVNLLDDRHRLVRRQAAVAVGVLGPLAKDGVPALTKLMGDVEGQNWYIRLAAFNALVNMPMDKSTRLTVMRTALHDPHSSVRAVVTAQTFTSKDAETRKASFQDYRSEMIEQMFNAPHGMFFSGARLRGARRLMETLSKDELRALQPRLLKSLANPGGGQLKGSKEILASFGEEVRPKLEALVKVKDMNTRCNAIATLSMIYLKNGKSPELVELLQRELKVLEGSDNAKRSSWARGLRSKLVAKAKAEK